MRYTRSLVGQEWRVLRVGPTEHSMFLSIFSLQQSRGCTDAARHWFGWWDLPRQNPEVV